MTDEESSNYHNDLPSLDDEPFPLLDDLILDQETKRDLEELVSNAKSPALYRACGIKPASTYLFNGPPGTGKTYSARAIRNTLRREGLKVLWAPFDLSLYGSKYVNESANRVEKFFTAVQQSLKSYGGKYDKAVVFIDECDDVIGQRGNRGSTGEDEKVTNAVMKWTNDIHEYGNDIVLIFGTNFEAALDKAAIRAGRIDKIVQFKHPGRPERERAFEYYIFHVNNQALYDVITSYDLQGLSVASEGFNYADISSVVEQSVRDKVYDQLQTDKLDERPVVTQEDLLSSIARHHRRLHKDDERRIGYGS